MTFYATDKIQYKVENDFASLSIRHSLWNEYNIIDCNEVLVWFQLNQPDTF